MSVEKDWSVDSDEVPVLSESEFAVLSESSVSEVQESEAVDPRSLLTSDQIQQFKDIFSALDPQAKGKIPSKLIGFVMRNLGHSPTKAEIRKFMSQADPEGKGLMDFQGFLLPIAENINEPPKTFEDIYGAFKTLDESDVGYIDSNLLYEYLTTLGETLEDYEIELLIKMADPKGTSKIMYQDFLERLFGFPKNKTDKITKGKKKK